MNETSLLYMTEAPRAEGKLQVASVILTVMICYNTGQLLDEEWNPCDAQIQMPRCDALRSLRPRSYMSDQW